MSPPLMIPPATWGLMAGLTGLAGYVPYVRDAWRRANDPDPAAWLIWTAEYSVLLKAQVAQDAPGAALWLAALQLAGTVAVLAVLVVRGGRWRFGPYRWALLGGTVTVLAAWPFMRAAGVAMCLALAAEGAGMILVITGTYRHPARETLLTWQAFTVAGGFDLPALGLHAPRLLYAYPAFFIVMGCGVLLAAALGTRAQRRAARYRRLVVQIRPAQDPDWPPWLSQDPDWPPWLPPPPEPAARERADREPAAREPAARQPADPVRPRWPAIPAHAPQAAAQRRARRPAVSPDGAQQAGQRRERAR